ncbi:MAG TPA: hypothetical protein VNH39_01040 [Steroidobacteraceae bacterium]|nr:hypothetical protein [Steroidobacteraceae bacterium]
MKRLFNILAALLLVATPVLANTTIKGPITFSTIFSVTGSTVTIPQASSSVFGVAKVDGTTITASGGVFTAVAGAGGITQLTGDCTAGPGSGSQATTCPAKVTPLTTGTSVSLSAPRGYFVCTGTCTITLPVPAAGDEFCVRNDNNVATVITFNNPGSSVQFEKTTFASYGTATTGTAVSAGAAGDKLCLVGRDTTHYLVGSYNGTWTMN